MSHNDCTIFHDQSFLKLFLLFISSKAFPIIFVLMSSKSQKSYEAVFEFIDAKIFDLSGTKMFITDFELASRNALRKRYPRSKQSGCEFHFAQAVRRKATKIDGFVDFIRKNSAAKKVYYKLMYLPLLPVNSIESTFKSLRQAADTIDKKKFEPFIKYYHKQWIKKEGAHKISVFGKEVRTTSSAEGYNRALGDYCLKKGSFIWFCVSIRNQEFMKSEEFGAYVESGGLVGWHQKKADKVWLIV